MLDTDNFPDEVKEALAPHMGVPDAEVLNSIGLAIVEKRQEAVNARQEIEGVWTMAEEAYIGIDDENRHEFGPQRWYKPPSMDGPVTTSRPPEKKNVKATAFVRLTARYVDAGAGKLTEILLPPDDRPFSFREMPVPDLIQAKDDQSPVAHDGMGGNLVPLFRNLKPGETPPAPPGQPAPAAPTAQPSTYPAQPQASAPPASAAAPGPAPAGGQPSVAAGAGAPPPGQAPLTVADLAAEKIEQARTSAKKAEDRVYNWMVECGHAGEVRKVIFDSARIGVGVIKGPVPVSKRGMMFRKGKDDIAELLIQNKINPATKWVDPWNCYPDPACGENIHDGDFFFEKDFLSERQVRKLKNEPGYIAAQLDKVLAEGPEKIYVATDGTGENRKPGEQKKRKRFPVWYYYGTLKRDEYLTTCGSGKGMTRDKAGSVLKPDQELVYCICTLINDTVVRVMFNPLESGELPYHAFPWQRRTGSWAGIGVGEQMRVPQRMVNAGTRAMLNNAGKSAGAQIVMNRACITPGDGRHTLDPDKIWFLNADAPAMSDVRQAFTIFSIPNVTPQMLSIIRYAMELAEESTSIPLVTQGQTNDSTPDTFGATQLQNNNANQLLRSIGYSFDDFITEPLIRQFYEWLLLDPDVPDDEKGEFEIDAHGSVALVERAIQNQTIGQMAALVLNPAYGLNPKSWAGQYIKINRLDPKDFKYTDEEQAKIDQTPPTPAPAVQAAQVRAASAEKIAAGSQQLDHDKAATTATVDLHELALKERLAMLEYSNKRGISLDQTKAELAKTAMTLETQKQLNAADNAVDLHKHHNPGAPKPAAEPLAQVPGKAGNGKAFSQAQ